MEIKTREVTNTVTEYIAEDGTEFKDKYRCEFHEWLSKATPVWAVSSRGSRGDSPELYSSEELALQAVGGSASHTITKVYLNERLWDTVITPRPKIDKLQLYRKIFFEEQGYMAPDQECVNYFKETRNEK